jgi:Transposase DDE domain
VLLWRNPLSCSARSQHFLGARGRHHALLGKHQGLPSLCTKTALHQRSKGAKRIVTRNLFEAEREHARALKGTEAFERSARERRKVEMAFAHLKRNLSFRRLRLRGITGARDEFLLAATVQNLRKQEFRVGGPLMIPRGDRLVRW